jgi:hypothetical protein
MFWQSWFWFLGGRGWGRRRRGGGWGCACVRLDCEGLDGWLAGWLQSGRASVFLMERTQSILSPGPQNHNKHTYVIKIFFFQKKFKREISKFVNFVSNFFNLNMSFFRIILEFLENFRIKSSLS